MREKEEVGTRERERYYCCLEIILLSLGFTFGVDSISKEVVVFLLYGFLEENICVHCLF